MRPLQIFFIIYKKIRKSLVEGSKQLISINGGGLTKDNVTDYCIIIDDIIVQISEILPESKIPTSEGCKAIIKTNVFNSILNYGKTVANGVQEKNSEGLYSHSHGLCKPSQPSTMTSHLSFSSSLFPNHYCLCSKDC